METSVDPTLLWWVSIQFNIMIVKCTIEQLVSLYCLQCSIVTYLTGMAGKDAVADAVLGGASDYMVDISAQLIKIYYAKDDEKVTVVLPLCLCIDAGLVLCDKLNTYN